MKILRPLLPGLILALTGCSTLSGVHWSGLAPWNWFSGAPQVNEQGVGGLTASTALDEGAISQALGSTYRLRSGMKTSNGSIVHYFEALRGDKLALVINGDNGTVGRIDVLDGEIETASGVRIGEPFHNLYSKAYGSCQKGSGDDSQGVECKAPGSQHISYLFSGEWSGPESLMPSDDTLKNWTLTKIIWRR